MDFKSKFREIGYVFLKLGLISFGGPVAHIALMHQELVVKKKWVTNGRFLDLIGFTNLIPGPNSTEMAIHLGNEKGGKKGLVIAGFCFIIPAVVITLFFAWLYKKYAHFPQIEAFSYGIKPAIIAIILSAIFPLIKQSLKTVALALIGLLAVILALCKVNQIFILFGLGFVALFFAYLKNESTHSLKNIFFSLTFFEISKSGLATISNINLFLIFLKIGAVLYGSGYVLFSFLDTELVATGIISRKVLIDAISIGQITPGPVFSSVTFIGYQINSWYGAVVSTIAIFLPSFIFVAFLSPLVNKMRNSYLTAAFLDATNIASVVLIIVTCFEMGKESLINWQTFLIMILSLIVVFYFKKLNVSYVIIGSSILGYFLNHIK